MKYHLTKSRIYTKDSRTLIAWVKKSDNGFFCVDRFGWGDFNVYQTKNDALKAYLSRK